MVQVIAFLHTYHAHWPEERSLLVVPANVVANWKQEFDKWLPETSNAEGLTRAKVGSTHIMLVCVDSPDSLIMAPKSVVGGCQ